MITVYPEPGNFSVIAKALLQAAGSPSEVAYVSHPKAGFRVPKDVFERFEAATSHGLSEQRQEASPAQTESRKRRPGRPRKNLLTPEELKAAIAAGTPKTQETKEE